MSLTMFFFAFSQLFFSVFSAALKNPGEQRIFAEKLQKICCFVQKLWYNMAIVEVNRKSIRIVSGAAFHTFAPNGN